MSRGSRKALALLLGTGGLFGAMFPLGKLASQAGVPPVPWSFVIAAGASLVLGLYALLTRRAVPLERGHRRYYLVSAAISFVAPNLIVFAAIPRLGAGFAAVMYTLSPVLTLAFSAAAGLRRPGLAGVLGIAVGLAGALTIVLSRGQVDRPGDPVWIGLALLIPVLLAAGNVYRTVDWPADADPLALAVGSNACAAGMLLAIGLAADGPGGFATLSAAAPLAAVQMAASAAMFALFFRLQQVGGPVFLSQIGYVGAAVGLVSGALVLGERYPAATWLGAVIVAVGVALVTWAQADRPDR